MEPWSSTCAPPANLLPAICPSPSIFPSTKLRPIWSRRIKDKNQVLLLHCQSGARSGVAKKKLIALGCPNAFNLGSYARAARIVAGK